MNSVCAMLLCSVASQVHFLYKPEHIAVLYFESLFSMAVIKIFCVLKAVSIDIQRFGGQPQQTPQVHQNTNRLSVPY